MGRVTYPSYRQTETLAENCIASKVGGTVTVSLWNYPTQEENVWEEVGTLPAGFRPSVKISTTVERGNIEVSTTGVVRVKRSVGAAANIYGGIAFS